MQHSDNKNPYKIIILDNGFRIVNWCREGHVSYIGISVNAGSRDEEAAKDGLAHFVEHTIFKGTNKRRAWQISSRMETVGGEINAYTSKEETMVYTNSPSGYEERGMELLADLVFSSRFPADEINREREVIIEEIHSYQDSPSESVYDEFEELAYKDSRLAHNILGNPESVRNLSGNDCRDFLDRFYTPKNMVMYCCSNLSEDKITKLANRYFGHLSTSFDNHSRIAPPPMSKFDITRDKKHFQANTITGARIFGRKDPRRFAIFLINNYLAGPCMNSRLNHELREKRGYVYTVDSHVSLLSDTGLLLIYFGCDPSNIGKCKRIIAHELDKLVQHRMSETALEKMKRQYCGQLLVSSDHIENRAMSLAKSLQFFGEIHDITTTTENIRAVTAEEVRKVAELISPEVCSTLTLL